MYMYIFVLNIYMSYMYTYLFATAGFNEDTGILPDEDDPGSDEDVEIELVEDEPAFLRGQTKMSVHHSPIKIVKVRVQNCREKKGGREGEGRMGGGGTGTCR